MDELSLRVRTAAFREILSTGRPVGVGELAVQTGSREEEVRLAVQRLMAASRARTDERGSVTASAGLSVRATWHRIKTQHGDAVVVVDASPNSEMVAWLKHRGERYYPPTTWKALARGGKDSEKLLHANAGQGVPADGRFGLGVRTVRTP